MQSTQIQRAVVVTALLLAGVALSACGSESEAELVSSARAYLQKNDQKAAVIQLKAALQLNPQSPEARFLLGDALLQSGEMAAAVVEFEKAHDLNYGDDAVLPRLARALNGTGQTKKVTDLYSRVVLSDPAAAAELKAAVGQAFAGQGQVERSQGAVDAALQLDPRNLAARLLSARLLAGRGEIDAALARVDSVLTEAPAQVEALNHKGQMLWFAKADREGAQKAFRDALTASPRYLPSHLGLISIALQRRDIDAFKSQVAELNEALPGHPESRFYSVQLALINGEFKAAREGAQQLLKVAPESARVLMLAGAIEAQAGSPILAETHLNKALQQSPTLAAARRMLADTYLRTDQPDKALATLQPMLAGPRPSAETLALAAAAHLQAGDAATAESFFNRAAQSAPDDPKLLTAQALSQISKGQVEAGFAQLESVTKADRSTYADLALISARLRRKEFDEALSAVERLKSKMPGKPVPDHLRGRILAQRGDAAGARSSFEKALTLDAAYFPAVSGLAALDIAEQKFDAARQRYEAVLSKDPRHYRALVAVAQLRQRTGAKPAEITTLLGDAVKANPAEAAPRLLLIEHLMQQRDWAAARDAARAAVAAVPDSVPLIEAQGRAYLAAGDNEQAIAAFRKSTAAQPGATAPLMALADAYARTKDNASAIASLRKALDLDPKLVVAYRGLAQLALMENRADDAVAIARQLQTRRPDEAVGHLLEAEAHANQRRWDAAIAATRAALVRDDSGLMAIRLHGLYLQANKVAEAQRFASEWERRRPGDADFQVHLATVALVGSKFADSEARFRKALSVRPDDALVLNNIAWLLVKQGKPGAVAMAERADKLLPGSTAIMDTLALALAADKRLDEAVDWQRKALALAPDRPSLRLNLAKLLVQSGNKDAARAELQILAKLGEGFAQQAEVSEILKTL